MSSEGSHIRRKHLQDVNLLHKESPYGNFYTPVIRSKIVGGRLIHIREENVQYRNSPRDLVGRHPLSPRSRTKPSQEAEAPDPVQSRRLEKLKLREDLLTERDPDGAGSHQQDQPQSARYGVNPYQPLPPINGGSVAMETTVALLNGLYSRLPPFVGRLAGSQIQLTRDEEFAVMRELQNQLRYLDTSKLKQVYSELASTDDELTGLCTFDELARAFVRNNIFLSDPLARLVASAFLSPYDQYRVNYEKVLSFIGASLQLGSSQAAQFDSSYYQPQQQQQQQQHNGLYYEPDDQAFDANRLPSPTPSPPPSPAPGAAVAASGLSHDRDLPRVLRQLEAEVAALFVASPDHRPINFEALRLAFQRADRLLRGTLSSDQMKRLVWDFRLPLSDQVLDSVVRLCRHRGGGQFDWEQFLGILERVIAPHSTGLSIPASKRPLEHARLYPQPTASWPHAEPGHQTGAQTPLYRSASPPPPTNRQPQQQQLQQQQLQLAEPWFNRFMKLADALYRRDSEARGFVNESQVKDLVLRYNDECQLGLDRAVVQAAVDASRVASGGVNINELLKRLSMR